MRLGASLGATTGPQSPLNPCQSCSPAGLTQEPARACPTPPPHHITHLACLPALHLKSLLTHTWASCSTRHPRSEPSAAQQASIKISRHNTWHACQSAEPALPASIPSNSAAPSNSHRSAIGIELRCLLCGPAMSTAAMAWYIDNILTCDSFSVPRTKTPNWYPQATGHQSHGLWCERCRCRQVPAQSAASHQTGRVVCVAVGGTFGQTLLSCKH